MRSIINCIILIVLVCLATNARADGYDISGTITNPDGKPLPGATVILSNDKITAADDEGKFIFHSIEPGTFTLSVTMVGYDAFTKKVKVKNAVVVVNIELKPQIKALNQVNIKPQISTSIGFKEMTREEGEAEKKKMLGPDPDPNIYDTEGNIVDSAKAAQMVRSLDYTMAYQKLKGQTAFKHVVIKTMPKVQLMAYEYMKSVPYLNVQSPELQDGQILNLKPIAKRIDTTTLAGKAVIMIFWCPQCYNGSKPDQYREINEAIAPFANSDKLQVLAITNVQPYEATDALKKSPILYARMLSGASAVTYKYEMGDQNAIIMTDTKHKIIFSLANRVPITSQVLHKLLTNVLN
jgi:hypothetical protein